LDVSKVDRMLHVVVHLLVRRRGLRASTWDLQTPPRRASAGGAGGRGSWFCSAGVGHGSTVRGLGWARAMVSDAGAGGERDGASGMWCWARGAGAASERGHGTKHAGASKPTLDLPPTPPPSSAARWIPVRMVPGAAGTERPRLAAAGAMVSLKFFSFAVKNWWIPISHPAFVVEKYVYILH
jgi:hypothetical protein